MTRDFNQCIAAYGTAAVVLIGGLLVPKMLTPDDGTITGCHTARITSFEPNPTAALEDSMATDAGITAEERQAYNVGRYAQDVENAIEQKTDNPDHNGVTFDWCPTTAYRIVKNPEGDYNIQNIG